MTALEIWKEQLARCRRSRPKQEMVWERLATWYDSWVENNDYVALVLPHLWPHLNPAARVLEIGPGTGAFTLPLARAVQTVVAVEPSANMRAALGRHMAEAGLDNLQLVPGRVEDMLETLPGAFDLALAANALYNVEPVDAVVRSLVRLARHTVILMGTGEQQTWQQALYRRFNGQERVLPPLFPQFYPVLLEMGIYADVHILRTSANYVYDSEEALVADWAYRLECEPAQHAELHAALLAVAQWHGRQIGIWSAQRMALIHIDAARHVFG